MARRTGGVGGAPSSDRRSHATSAAWTRREIDSARRKGRRCTGLLPGVDMGARLLALVGPRTSPALPGARSLPGACRSSAKGDRKLLELGEELLTAVHLHRAIQEDEVRVALASAHGDLVQAAGNPIPAH